MSYNFTRQAWLKHVFFVFFFLVLPALVFERLPGESVFTVTDMIVQYTIANIILLCFFYLNYYIFLPRYFFEKKYLLYVLCVILFLIITFPLPHLIIHGMDFRTTHPMQSNFPPAGDHFPPPGPSGHSGHQPPQNFGPAFSFSFDEFRRHLYLFFTAFFFSFLLKTREHLSQLKEDKLNAELMSLKAQINPHFLFNTLNTIYALSIKKDDKASDAITHLSGLMRYVIKDANDNKIPLLKELDYITNYIELQKARLGNTAHIYFDIFGDAGNKKITPLIFITYIENAFKYGVNPDISDCVIKVRIDIADNSIRLYTFNKKVSSPNRTESTGIGLQNTNERLAHLYPMKYDLEIMDKEDSYSVILSITMT